jgi:hypothetical protein
VASFPDYGALFKNTPSYANADVGKQHLADALKVLENRWAQGPSLRALPLEPGLCAQLTQQSVDFLAAYGKALFELDNLKHVKRLMQNIERYKRELIDFLGIDAEQLKLVAALHDLGKSHVPWQMGKFVSTIFSPDDFINTRVLPHELYSIYWIHEMGKERRLHPGLTHLLMDQISNHNFGPDLSDPANAFLLEKRPNGAYKHWWLQHWQVWSQKLRANGILINEQYGCTLSPIATSLVLFDRIDGGHPHSWEKFLNQGRLAGQIEFSINFISDILGNAHECAVEQVLAVGRQIRNLFIDSKKNTPLLEFAPLTDALQMLEQTRTFILRLQESNRMDRIVFFKIDPKKSILYQDQKSGWIRIDCESASKKATKSVWENNEWLAVQTSDRPIDMLLETIYKDWADLH